ncbi:DUF1345 domain-containing protein [Rugosimonospora africana]|uniref:DUF1345 domain-containing protein n=1 Tax=Rugosimonospora africana TaxID=556532 RepID=UPI001EF2B25C|nr:DUF1345 domain-containing protein [Rugosimonospora africana]
MIQPPEHEHRDSDAEPELQAFESEHEREHLLDHGREEAQHAALKVRLARLELLAGLGKTNAGRVTHYLPAWLRKTQGENRFAVATAVLVVIALQVAIAIELSLHPEYLVPALEVVLLVLLSIGNPVRLNRESPLLRAAGLLLVTAASIAVAWSAMTLVWRLLHGTATKDPVHLLLTGGGIWLMNVIVFALWYWELDRGGPAARASARKIHPDFLFSQMTVPELVRRDWEPGFVDYLYLSFTNATAFSPTDTLPLSRWAKLAMMFQSLISLVTVALVVARAVNILK